MDNRYLKYILTLAETGNMTRAAKKLYISQPTLSQFLVKEEAELGTPLFKRSSGIYTLTPVGELYAEYARKVISMTNTLEKEIQRISTTSHICVGTGSVKSTQIFTAILADFHKQYPLIEISLIDGNYKFLSNSLQNDEVDIVLITIPSPDIFQGNSINLKSEEILLAIPTSYLPEELSNSDLSASLSSKDVVQYFGQFPFIIQRNGSCIRSLVDSFFQKVNFKPYVACYTSYAQSICDMVLSNIGAGFIPRDNMIESPHVKYFSLNPPLYRIHSIVYRKDMNLSNAHKFFISLAEKYVSDLW